MVYPVSFFFHNQVEYSCSVTLGHGRGTHQTTEQGEKSHNSRGHRLSKPPAQRNAVAPHPGRARRSRTATRSTKTATTESELAELSRPTRKTMTRGTKARAIARASPEPEAEPAKSGLRRGTRSRSQSVKVAPTPAPALATTKSRAGVKSKKAVNNVLAQDAPAEDPPVGGTARRGKTKAAAAAAAAAETEDESTGTSTLRAARGGRRTPNGTSTGTTGAASNRVTAVSTTSKGRMFVGVGTSLRKSAEHGGTGSCEGRGEGADANAGHG